MWCFLDLAQPFRSASQRCLQLIDDPFHLCLDCLHLKVQIPPILLKDFILPEMVGQLFNRSDDRIEGNVGDLTGSYDWFGRERSQAFGPLQKHIDI